MKITDLKPGDYVTVLRWKRLDRSYIGDVLEVKHVEPPFVVTKRIKEYLNQELNNIIINTEECDIMQLTPQYVECVAGVKIESVSTPAILAK